MLSSYPLSRCPACKKAFRMEIKSPTPPPTKLGLAVCPYCGMQFQRFDSNYLKGATSRAVAQ